MKTWFFVFFVMISAIYGTASAAENGNENAAEIGRISGKVSPHCAGLISPEAQIVALYNSFRVFDYLKHPIYVSEVTEGHIPQNLARYRAMLNVETFMMTNRFPYYQYRDLFAVRKTLWEEQDLPTDKSLFNELIGRLSYERIVTIAEKARREDIQEVTFWVDNTIVPPPGRKSLEIASPLMRSHTEEAMYDIVLDRLKGETIQFQAALDAGLHIYADFFHPTAPELALFTILFSKIDKSMREFVKASQNRQVYIMPLSENLVRYAFTTNPDMMTLHQLQVLHGDKDRIINFHSPQNKKGRLTIKNPSLEIRVFNSTLDPYVRKFFRSFGRKLVRAVRTKDLKLKEFLTANASRPEASFVELLRVLGFTEHRISEVQERL